MSNRRFFLAGAISDDRWNYAPVTIVGSRKPLFPGSISEFINQNPDLHHQMTNKVRRCHACHKSCGKTVEICNNCGASLLGSPIVESDNALMGFVYGIQYCDNYFLATSIRYQDTNFLVYDDIMQTTPVHLNSIPSYVYVPDFRYLFSNPKKGLTLITDLFENAIRAAVVMLSNVPFREKFFSREANMQMDELGLDAFARQNALHGFNYPPSQYQIHLQFIIPPYTPYHRVLFDEGKHGNLNRFFTFDFIRKVLLFLEKSNQVIDVGEIEEISGENLVQFIHRKTLTTIDYYEHFRNAMRKHRRNNESFSNWKECDFRGLVERLTYDQVSPEFDKTLRNDKRVLESYGKGPLGLQFYSFAKKPGEVILW
jgi:hypothetical protein